MMDNTDHKMDQIFREKFKNAKASPPGDMWDRIRNKRNNRPYPQRLFNGWKMFFWFLVLGFSVSLGGGFMNQGQQDGLAQKEEDNVQKELARSATVLSDNNHIGSANASESFVPGNQQPLGKEEIHIFENGLRGMAASFEFDGAGKKDDEKQVQDSENDAHSSASLEEELEESSPNKAPKDNDKQEPLTLISDQSAKEEISLLAPGRVSVPSPSIREGVRASPELNDFNNWFVNFNIEYGAGNQRLSQIHHDSPGSASNETRFNMQGGYSAGLSFGRSISSGFFVEGGLSYRRMESEKASINREMETFVEQDTVDDGQIVFPNRDSEEHTVVETIEKENIHENVSRSSETISFYGAPIKMGYKYHHDWFNLEFTLGGRAEFFTSPESLITSQSGNVAGVSSTELTSIGEYSMGWNWMMGAHGEYHLSSHYSLMAGFNSYMPVYRDSDGLFLENDEVTISPRIQLRYNF